jgi:DNA-binding transcriptional regulator YhcF (GntR family)
MTGWGDDSTPALEIYRQFRGLIASGQLGAGERLPTVRQSAGDLGVAPGTVAKAYKMLERDGIVDARVGSGTRVSAKAAVLPGAVVRRIRELIAEADTAGVSADDVADALRTLWASRAG